MSDLQMINILLLLLVIVVLVFVMVILLYNKKIKKQDKDIIIINNKTVKNNYFYTFYIFFSNFALTKRYIRKIRKQIEILKPESLRKTAEKTMKTAFVTWGVILVAVLIILMNDISLYGFCISIMVIYILNNQILYMIVNNADIKLLKQLELYLGDVRHYYHIHGMVDEAIYESSENAGYEMRLHIDIIYEILISKDLDDEIGKYKDIAPNKYLKTFLALCVTVIKYGDKKIDGQSLFLTNLKYLKQEINIELLKKEKVNYLFSGLIFMAVFPMFFLKTIEGFGIYCMPELKLHYMGAFGIIVSVIVFLTTMISYTMLNKLKESNEYYVKEHIILVRLSKVKYINKTLNRLIEKKYGKAMKIGEMLKKIGENITIKQFMLKKILTGLCAFMGCILLSLIIHICSGYITLNYTENIDNISSISSKEQVEVMKKSVKKYSTQYKKTPVTKEELEEVIKEEGVVKHSNIIELTTEEVLNRLIEYKSNYYKWYELVVSILVSIIAYNIPYLMILYRTKIMRMNMEDEVIQFQSIILMLMNIDRMTVEKILEYLEDFAIIFKASIEECINNIETGDLGVLEQLKLDEPFEPFRRLVDNLLISDKIGIEKAFDEIVVERTHYQDKRKQENEVYINNKAVIGKVLAYIPLLLTIGLHLIIPFVIEGLKQLTGFMGQMQGL